MLYLLKDRKSNGYDVMDSCIVRSTDPKTARKLANKVCKDEGEIWTDCQRVSCRSISTNAMQNPSKVILTSIRNG